MTNKENIAVLGAGNLGYSIAKGLVKAGVSEANQITLTRRNMDKISQHKEEGFKVTTYNKSAVVEAKYIFLCVQPKQLGALLAEIEEVLDPKKHVLISTITGVSLEAISGHLKGSYAIVRSMPNTATAIAESMTCLCANKEAKTEVIKVENLFQALGDTLIIEERMMKAATVLAASGIAFFLRYIRAATQGGIQLGFDAEEAQKIAVQTARGAASLLAQKGTHPETEIDKVTTPQGCTISGLNEMEHQGLSSALIRGIVASYEKINGISE